LKLKDSTTVEDGHFGGFIRREIDLERIMHRDAAVDNVYDLRSKLHDLRALRAEIDEDIVSLERVVRMMDWEIS
jgi:hypothetical protein